MCKSICTGLFFCGNWYELEKLEFVYLMIFFTQYVASYIVLQIEKKKKNIRMMQNNINF